MYCQNCGKKNSSGEAYCTECGMPIVATEKRQQPTMQKCGPKHRRFNLLAIVAVLLVVIVAVAALLFFEGAKDDAVEPTFATVGDEMLAVTEENTESTTETEDTFVDSKVTITYVTSFTMDDGHEKMTWIYEYPENWIEKDSFTVQVWSSISDNEGHVLQNELDFTPGKQIVNHISSETMDFVEVIYDENGRVEQNRYVFADSEAEKLGYKELIYSYTYVEDTHLLERQKTIQLDADGNTVEGKIDEATYQEQDGGYVREVIFENFRNVMWYNVDGRRVRQETYLDEELLNTTIVTYDESGNECYSETFIKDGQNVKHEYTYATIEVDEAFAEMYPCFKPVK